MNKFNGIYIYIHTHIYVCMCVYIYIYINLKEGYRFLPYQIKGKRYLKKSLLEDMFIDFREGGGRERKRNICTPYAYVGASHMHPNQVWNLQHFGVWDYTSTN